MSAAKSESRAGGIRFSALGVYLQGMKTALASRMAYRGDFIMSMFIMMIVEFAGPVITMIIYGNGASFPGWSQYEVLLLQGIFLLSRGISFPFFMGIVWNTIGRVKEGTLDLLLIKPRSILLMSVVTAFDSEDLGKLIGGILVFRYALKKLPPQPLSHWISFFLLFLFSLILMFALALFMAGLGIVWVGNYRIYDIFDLKDLVKKPTRQLSLGERMKCEFIMAMLHKPPIVFLDEPTIGLDVIAKEKIRDFIREQNKRGTTFILTTHDLEDVERLAKRVIVINHGEIVFDGGMDRLKLHLGDKRTVRITTREKIKLENNGGIVVKKQASDYEMEVELDLSVVRLNEFIQRINEESKIRDLSVEGPELEEIIKKLYTA